MEKKNASKDKPTHQEDVLAYGPYRMRYNHYYIAYYNDGWYDMNGDTISPSEILYWAELPEWN